MPPTSLRLPDENPKIAENGPLPGPRRTRARDVPADPGVEEARGQAAAGEVQVKPANLPLTLLVWSASRVAPGRDHQLLHHRGGVRLPRLNPIRAKVDLGLKVLTSLEFPSSSVGRDAYIAYQKNKEQLAGEFTNSTDDQPDPDPPAGPH